MDEANQTEQEIIIEEMVIPNKANQTLSIRIQQRVNKSCFLYISVTVDPLRPSDQIEGLIIIIIMKEELIAFALARYGCGGMETRNLQSSGRFARRSVTPQRDSPVARIIGESLFTLFASLTYAYHYLMTLIK